MKILRDDKIKLFNARHPESRKPLSRWVEVIEKTAWANMAELKTTFPAVDYLPPSAYCFNIAGNKYRLIAGIAFSLGTVQIDHIFTHAEYDKWNTNK
jgi:mRNA interferase HigB